jgi:nucleoside-diphosphate-sugar epimerase
VLHLATCKEVPEAIMDVTVKGMFWVLEEARQSSDFQQFILVGGDAAVGHMYLPRERPITEEQRHTAYKGCYALSKVLEEVLLEQYYIQYDLNGVCLRAPWIMCLDDFKRQLSFGPDVFGEPLWGKLVGPEKAAQYVREHAVPILLDLQGEPVLRNFVQVEDLVEALLLALDHPRARQQTFNICMDEPVNYRDVARYLNETRGYPGVEVRVERYSNWLDNSKAKFLLGWRPAYDLRRMIDAAFAYGR